MPTIQGFKIKDGKMTDETIKKLEAAGVKINPFGAQLKEQLKKEVKEE